MKLVLTSSDFTSEEILGKIVEFAGKPAKEISVAVLNEASAVEVGDKRWLIEGVTQLVQTFGGEIDIVNLLALDIAEVEKRMQFADVIFCFGGNAEWLKRVFERTGFSSLLPKLLQSKVWVGSSAGSLIVGRRASSKLQDALYGQEEYYGVEEYEKLVNFSVLPHIFNSFVVKNALDLCLEESKMQKYPVYAISDDAAIAVDDEKIALVGKGGFKMLNGEIVEQV